MSDERAFAMATVADIESMEKAARDEVRAEVLRELLDWEREYMQQASGGDQSGRSDAKADAAREIADHLRSSWETRNALSRLVIEAPSDKTIWRLITTCQKSYELQESVELNAAMKHLVDKVLSLCTVTPALHSD